MRVARHRTSLLAAGTALAVLATVSSAHARDAAEQNADQSVQNAKEVPKKKGRAAAELDVLTVTASKSEAAAIDQLAGVSVISSEDLARIQAIVPSDIFLATPGVAASPLGNDPGTIMNIRGLQDFGRVAVTLDGARQNFSRNSHAGNGTFYLEPEILKSATVIRGPVANAYGSGAIGGVVVFETIDPRDIIADGDSWALQQKLGYDSNSNGFVSSSTGAMQYQDVVGVLGNFTYRDDDDYANGAGVELPYTGQLLKNGLVKSVITPDENNTIELSGILFHDDYVASRSAGLSIATREAVTTENKTASARWTYSNPDDRLFDFQGTLYWNETTTDMVKTGPSNSNSTGDIGDQRGFETSTLGFDLHNASRVDGLGFQNTFTYGADYFHDDATNYADLANNGSNPASATGAGERGAYGAFLEWTAERGDWLELITALRYDGYTLDGLDAVGDPVSQDGGRLSPRATIGITPLAGLQFYGTYAEGYRAPSITETFVGGSHQNDFAWVPNPNLKPEIAHTFEIGTNVKYDGILTADDALRMKLAAFHTTVDNYIDTVLISTGPNVSQYQNIDEATLKGIEAEGQYDWNWAYVSLAGSLISAERSDGGRLNNAPLDKFATTVGFRSPDQTFSYGAQWVAVGNGYSIAFDMDTPSYDLFNVFASWQPRDNLSLDFRVDNIFDTEYTDPQSGYMNFTSDPFINGKGRSFKFNLTARIGG